MSEGHSRGTRAWAWLAAGIAGVIAQTVGGLREIDSLFWAGMAVAVVSFVVLYTMSGRRA